MKKAILFLILIVLFIFTFFSCGSLQKNTKTSWVERLTQSIIIENDLLYSNCSFVDRDSMIKNIAAEGLNPFIYKDPVITKQESILFSILIIPKINFTIYANEINIKTESGSYPVIFKEFALNNNMYETSIESQTKEMKDFVTKYFISQKENYSKNERKVRFLYSVVNYQYKGVIVRIPIHTQDGKIFLLIFTFNEIKR